MGTKYCLVYQAGIANIFKVKCFNLADFGRNEKFYFQGTKLHYITFNRCCSLLSNTYIFSKKCIGENLVLTLKWRT